MTDEVEKQINNGDFKRVFDMSAQANSYLEQNVAKSVNNHLVETFNPGTGREYTYTVCLSPM